MTPERLESAQRIVETVIHEQMSDIAFHRILVTYDSEAYGSTTKASPNSRSCT